MKRIVFKLGKTLQVFKLDSTPNGKIAKPGERIVQSYTYSLDQFHYVRDNLNKGIKNDFNTFFSFDFNTCGNCPFSRNSLNDSPLKGKCYTHSYDQYSGFISQLRSIAVQYPNELPEYNFNNVISEFRAWLKLRSIVNNKFVYTRFGSYGEPSKHPIDLIEFLVNNSNAYTGYTHQWRQKPEFSAYFQSSVHSLSEEKEALQQGWLSYIVTDQEKLPGLVHCPSSKENKRKNVSCSSCGLCSGTSGKGSKSIYIFEH